MGQALCTCSECGTAVRRDDGPLALPSEQPKRIAFTSGAGALLSLDFCNDCFASALEGAQRRVTFTRAAAEPAPVLRDSDGRYRREVTRDPMNRDDPTTTVNEEDNT